MPSCITTSLVSAVFLVGDVKAQTRQVLERIDQLLQMAGTDKSEAFGGPGLAGGYE
jgi:enamine deaminase RidA (YjgF/YER057c/UK114 family)